MNITVIGAGNAGVAISGHLALQGYSVCLYNRSAERISGLIKNKKVHLTGKVYGTGTLAMVTTDIQKATIYGDIIFIATVANAHRELAVAMSSFLRPGQVIVLNPGRTGGLLEFRNALHPGIAELVHIAEAQTLMYACRTTKQGGVDIIGIKKMVFLAGFDKSETEYVVNVLSKIYSCFYPARNYLQTGLENIGAILHPPIVLFNAAVIDRGQTFYFYRDISKQIADYILGMDAERIRIGHALGLELHSVEDWISYAYDGIAGNTFLEKIKNNPAYYDIVSPSSLFARQLTEDLPTGLVPMSELGRVLHIQTPMINAAIDMGCALLGIDFRLQGRTLERLGIKEGKLCSEL